MLPFRRFAASVTKGSQPAFAAHGLKVRCRECIEICKLRSLRIAAIRTERSIRRYGLFATITTDKT